MARTNRVRVLISYNRSDARLAARLQEQLRLDHHVGSELAEPYRSAANPILISDAIRSHDALVVLQTENAKSNAIVSDVAIARDAHLPIVVFRTAGEIDKAFFFAEQIDASTDWDKAVSELVEALIPPDQRASLSEITTGGLSSGTLHDMGAGATRPIRTQPAIAIGLQIPPDESQNSPVVVVFFYIRGDQTIRVHALRTDIDDFAQQQLSPAAQNDLIRKNRQTLEPVIEGKVHADTASWTEPTTGRPMAFIQLTRADLEQGLRRYRVTSQAGIPMETGSAPVVAGAELALGPLTLRATATVTLAMLSPALSNQDRVELAGRLDAVEARLIELLPVVEALQNAPPDDDIGPGHNNPPDDEPPMSPADVELGAAAIVSMRVELSQEQQRRDVYDVAGKALAATARAVLALSRWIGARGTVFVDAILKAADTAIVTTAFLHGLHVDLADLAAKIASILGHPL